MNPIYQSLETRNRSRWCLGAAWLVTVLSIMLFASGVARAAESPLRIVQINSFSGPFAEGARELSRGFMLGLEFATEGTLRFDGRPLEWMRWDDGFDPERARQLVTAAYTRYEADLVVGPGVSALALAVAPLAEQYRRPLLVQGRLDALTGRESPYVIRVGRTVGQDAAALARAVGAPGVCLAAFAQDYRIGHEGIAAFERAAAATGARWLGAVFQPVDVEALIAELDGLLARLHDEDCPQGRYVFLSWEGAAPLAAVEERMARVEGVTLAMVGLPARPLAVPVEGVVDYFYRFAPPRANDWLVVRYLQRFRQRPGPLAAQGFTEAVAVVSAWRRAGRAADPEALRRAFAGLSVRGASGAMRIDAAERQGRVPYFHFHIDAGDAAQPVVPTLRGQL